MPPLPVIANVARISIIGDNVSPPMHTVNVIHVQRVDDTHSWPSILQWLADNFNGNMWAACPIGWFANHLTALPLDGTTATIDHVVTNPNRQGGSGGDLTPQIAAIVSLKTAQRGRRGRGRIYLPTAESSVGDGRVTGTIVGDLETGWGTFLDALVADGRCAVGVASYRDRVWRQATQVVIREVTGTQRRRVRQFGTP